MGVRGLTVVPLLISIANAVSRRLLKKAEYAKAERINAIIAKLPSAVLTCDDLKVGAPILAMEPIQQTLQIGRNVAIHLRKFAQHQVYSAAGRRADDANASRIFDIHVCAPSVSSSKFRCKFFPTARSFLIASFSCRF